MTFTRSAHSTRIGWAPAGAAADRLSDDAGGSARPPRSAPGRPARAASGGDRTLEIDEAAEDVVFDELDALHAEGPVLRALRGARRDRLRRRRGAVVIDPIDGSLNAKRGLPHHALSIAVADGTTMADVAFAYVFDFGPREEWWARRGEGAWLNGERARPDAARAPRRATAGSRCSASSRPIRAGSSASIDELRRGRVPAARDRRDRLLALPGRGRAGSTGWSRCAAAGRSTPPPAQLIVREAGGLVASPAATSRSAAPLDADAALAGGRRRERRRRCASSSGSGVVIDWIIAERMRRYVGGHAATPASRRSTSSQLATESERASRTPA